MHTRLAFLLLLPLAAALAPGVPARAAAPYDFVVLASSLRAVQPSIEIAPSIDDDGSVAFIGNTAGGSEWVLVEDEPGSTVLADYRIMDGGPDYFFALGLPDSLGSFTDGWVAYRRFVRSEPAVPPYVIAQSDGGVVRTLYAGPELASPAPPAANAAGQFAFFRDGVPDQIVRIQGGVETVIAELFAPLGDGRTVDLIVSMQPDIDDAGRVVFAASVVVETPTICDDEILLSGVSGPETLATGGVLRDDCLFQGLDLTQGLAVNDVGQAAFGGRFRDALGETSVDAVYVNDTVVWEERMPGFPPLFGVGAVAINDVGTVAFWLATLEGASLLQLGPDPVADRLVGTGDALCDGTVTELYFQRFGLNDANEVAFGVALDDGRRLIVRAEPSAGPGGECIRFPGTVPEPGGVAATLVGVAALGALRASRRTQPRPTP